MPSRKPSVNAAPRLFTRISEQEESALIEDLASEEAFYEQHNWFGMRPHQQQFYRDRVTRIIASLRTKTSKRKRPAQ